MHRPIKDRNTNSNTNSVVAQAITDSIVVVRNGEVSTRASTIACKDGIAKWKRLLIYHIYRSSPAAR